METIRDTLNEILGPTVRSLLCFKGTLIYLCSCIIFLGNAKFLSAYTFSCLVVGTSYHGIFGGVWLSFRNQNLKR